MARREHGESVTEILAMFDLVEALVRVRRAGERVAGWASEEKRALFQRVLFLERPEEIFVRRPAFDAPRHLTIWQETERQQRVAVTQQAVADRRALVAHRMLRKSECILFGHVTHFSGTKFS